MKTAESMITLFVTCAGNYVSADEVVSCFAGKPLAYLRDCPQVISINIFVPDTDDVPRFEDGVGPPLIAQIDVDSPAGAEELVKTDSFSESVMANAVYPESVQQTFLDAFETIHCPLFAEAKPPPRSAPLSFVVRYYRPVASESQFIRTYMADHPPLMTGFPGIRNIICYVPHRLKSADRFPNSGAFFGNEVVFDDLPALNNALASDVLPKLKDGRRKFIPFGHNTHYAMHREQIYQRQ